MRISWTGPVIFYIRKSNKRLNGWQPNGPANIITERLTHKEGRMTL